jgi:transcriptional regulator with XRE-family HTH domain
VVYRKQRKQTLLIVNQEELQIGLGQRVVSYRKARGMTQDDLGEAASMSRNALSDIELGKSDLRISTVRRLAVVLGVTVAELMPDYPT